LKSLYFVFFIIILSAPAILFILKNKNKEKSNHSQPENSNEPADYNYSKAYQTKFLLSKNEYYAFKKLQSIALSHDLFIFPKVRVLDLIEPIKGQRHYKTYLYKIQSKHVDFVICDKKLSITCIIELDDNSHNREDRKERDRFLDEVFNSVGYSIIHTKAITEDIESKLISLCSSRLAATERGAASVQ